MLIQTHEDVFLHVPGANSSLPLLLMSVLILAQQIRLYLFTVILIQDSALRLAQIITSDMQLLANVYLRASPIIICLYIT